jgi:hypothetical protein
VGAGAGGWEVYALVRCRCGEFLIAKSGQKWKCCPFCGRRFRLGGYIIYFRSGSVELIRRMRGMRMDDGQHLGFYRPCSPHPLRADSLPGGATSQGRRQASQCPAPPGPGSGAR